MKLQFSEAWLYLIGSGWLDHNGRAKQDELLVDIENIEFFYFPMSRIFGMIPESAEGLEKCENSLQSKSLVC